jgi:hypothetical protein
MIFGRKVANAPTQGDFFASLLQVVFEVLDRTAHIEGLLRNNTFPLLNSEDRDGDLAAKGGGSYFLREKGKLTSFRRELLLAELQIDASLNKIALLCGGERAHLEPLDGHFLGKLDRAISDYIDVNDPNSPESTQYFASNYLIKEEKFPYGHVFDEGEVQVFFEKMRDALGDLIREFTP